MYGFCVRARGFSSQLLILASLSAILPQLVTGHGYIYYPPARGGNIGTAANDYTPQGLGAVDLPMDTCGKPKYLDMFDPKWVTKLDSGGKIEIAIDVTAHHKGHFVFRLCDKRLASSLGGFAKEEECLQQHILERVRPEEMHDDCQVDDVRGDCAPIDDANPGHWYLPAKRTGEVLQVAGSNWDDSMADMSPPEDPLVKASLLQETTALNSSTQVKGVLYKMHYWLPKGFSCEQCTMQWWWRSANSCNPHTDAYNCYFKKVRDLGWSISDWAGNMAGHFKPDDCPASGIQRPPAAPGCGEEFKNCADVIIVGNGGGDRPDPKPRPAPIPAPQTTQAPAPMPGPAPVPTPPKGAGSCELNSDCTSNPWCREPGFPEWCRNFADSECPSPHCAVSSTDTCGAVVGNLGGATDDKCREACADIPHGVWPCDATLCTCDRGGDIDPRPEPEPKPTMAPMPAPTPAPTPEPKPITTRAPAPTGEEKPCYDGSNDSCKKMCQSQCLEFGGGGVKVNQCWGEPRYIQCLCADDSSHVFDGCPCKNSQCT